MLKAIKSVTIVAVLLVLVVIAVIYGVLMLSLPPLSGSLASNRVSDTAYLQRDELGTAIITAENRFDASYALGFAHGQDRFFQMDLLRRNAAGELSELFGEAALPVDENRRFHQFRKRSEKGVASLSPDMRLHLERYAQGVNDALMQTTLPPFEYLLLQTKPAPWQPADSLLAIYSMYLDLQGVGLERDLLVGALHQYFGKPVADFLLQPSPFQAALDNSQLALYGGDIPPLEADWKTNARLVDIQEQVAVGSNNWAVSGALTPNGKAMLSDDMHLGLRVPTIWYRIHMTVNDEKGQRQLTGVSLPGAPAMVVGSNGKVAWGFTNGYLDTADWYRLAPDENTRLETEVIPLKDGEHKYLLEVCDYGPVRVIDGQKYALTWVAHRDYAVNLNLLNLERAGSVDEALALTKQVGIPVQNMVLADTKGDIAWQVTGAVPARQTPLTQPQSSQHYDPNWTHRASDIPVVKQPQNGRIWTANARVVSAEQDAHFGNGGYALGARSAQIRDRLLAQEQFTVDDFYKLQLDNEALFLSRWQALLLKVLQSDASRFSQDITALQSWGSCACADSVGYTLTRKYRDALIDALFAPIESQLAEQSLSLSLIERQIEPALWQLVSQQPASWLPNGAEDWQRFLVQTYVEMRDGLMTEMTGHADGSLQALAWGKVNTLRIQHPFSRQFPILGAMLDMPGVEGFGDKFMPAVQGRTFGASQRLIVQPGDEANGVLTLPGGQSGHPLSPFYRQGFHAYADQALTPLLPGEPLHQITFFASSAQNDLATHP